MPKYVFSTTLPPLLKDFGGDILSVPRDELKSLLGTSNYTVVGRTEYAPDAVDEFWRGLTARQQCRTTFSLRHFREWRLTANPAHYAAPVGYKIEIKKGYSVTDKTTFERTVGGSVGLGIAQSIFPEGVKAELKWTEEVTKEWHEEVTVTTDRAYEADTTYCTWELFDVLALTKRVESPILVPALGYEHWYTIDSALVNRLIFYEDHLSDKDRKIIASIKLSASIVKF
jgi:hypothetical protein